MNDKQQDNAEFITHLMNGNNSFFRGDLDRAIEQYKIAIELNPGFARTYAKLGEAYYKKKEYDAAIENFRISLELNPDQAQTTYHLGKAYDDSGRHEEAAETFDIALVKDRGGDYTAAINHRRRRIKRHASSRSMNDIRTSGVISNSLLILAKRPQILLPVLVAAASILAADFVATEVMKRIFGSDYNSTWLLQYLFTGHYHFKTSAIIYYSTLGLIFSFVTIPLYVTGSVMACRAYSGMPASLLKSVKQILLNLSHLSSLSFIYLTIQGFSVIIMVTIVHLIMQSLHEMVLITVFLRPAALVAFPLTGVFFLIAAPSVAMEHRSMESGLRKGWNFGLKYFFSLFALLGLYTAAHVLLHRFIEFGYDFGFAIEILLLTPLQAFVAVIAGIIFVQAQTPARKKRIKHKKQITDTDDDSPEDDLDEIDEDDYDPEPDDKNTDTGIRL